jgi:hypothetical protein
MFKVLAYTKIFRGVMKKLPLNVYTIASAREIRSISENAPSAMPSQSSLFSCQCIQSTLIEETMYASR